MSIEQNNVNDPKTQVEVKEEFPNKVFIGNLDAEHKEEQLTELFKPFGSM